MSACNDFIDFDLLEDWERVVNISKEATIQGENSHLPIPAFDLEVSLSTPYIAVIASSVNSKITWNFAGTIRQTFDFPTNQNVNPKSLIQSEPIPLQINTLQTVELKQYTGDNFGLRYKPPTWFKDCVIQVYIYKGEVANFVKDTLFDIGNKLGTGTIDDPTSLQNLFDAQANLISSVVDRIDSLDANLASFSTQVSDLQASLDEFNNDTIRQIREIDAGLVTLAKQLGSLLPENKRKKLNRDIKNDLNINEELT